MIEDTAKYKREDEIAKNRHDEKGRISKNSAVAPSHTQSYLLQDRDRVGRVARPEYWVSDIFIQCTQTSLHQRRSFSIPGAFKFLQHRSPDWMLSFKV